jgi:predicted enzyme related to lactoylglutathione lyase
MGIKSICGVILVSNSAEGLAKFYSEALQLEFAHEDHGSLASHWGVDIGTVHLGIHPPENFKRSIATNSNTVIAYDVDSLADCRTRIESLGGKCIEEPHDEGFGLVASFLDPQGNQFEITELSYEFQS